MKTTQFLDKKIRVVEGMVNTSSNADAREGRPNPPRGAAHQGAVMTESAKPAPERPPRSGTDEWMMGPLTNPQWREAADAHMDHLEAENARLVAELRERQPCSDPEHVILRESHITRAFAAGRRAGPEEAAKIVEDVHAHCPVHMGQPYALAYNGGWFDSTERIRARIAALDAEPKAESAGEENDG